MKKVFSIILILIIYTTTAQTNYKNEAFGFSAIMPQGWVKSEYAQTTKDTELTEAARTEMLEERGSVYLTDYHKVNAPMRGPKIQINAINKPEKSYEAFKKEAISSAEKLKKHFKNFEYLQKPLEVTVGGIKSVHFIIKHDMMVMGSEMKVRNHIYAVPYKNYLFMITLTDVESDDCTQVFEAFVKSIKIGQ